MKTIDKIREHNRVLLASENGTRVDVKSKQDAEFRAAIGFASEYRYAMHTLGFQYVYFYLNQRKDFFCERFYYPDKGLLPLHKRGKIPLLTQETNSPVKGSDIILFSLNYEGNYPKLFEMLRLIGLPTNSSERRETDPVYIAGGICPTYNPHPISRYFDAIVVGEAESVLPGLADEFKKLRRAGRYTKAKYLSIISKHRGVYRRDYKTIQRG